MKKRILAMASAVLLGGCGPATVDRQTQEGSKKTLTVDEVAAPLDATAQAGDSVTALVIETGTSDGGRTSISTQFDNFNGCINFGSSQTRSGYGSRDIICTRKRDGATYQMTL